MAEDEETIFYIQALELVEKGYLPPHRIEEYINKKKQDARHDAPTSTGPKPE